MIQFRTLCASAKYFLVLGLLSACTPMTAVRGNIVDDYQIGQLQPGTMTQADVVRIVGSPTTQDPFDPNIWYYMGQKTAKKGILDPKVTNERILRLTFDTAGTLTAVEPIQNTRNDVAISDRKTPTEGHEINAVQQMLGNLGKFNKSGDKPKPY